MLVVGVVRVFSYFDCSRIERVVEASGVVFNLVVLVFEIVFIVLVVIYMVMFSDEVVVVVV